MTVKLMEMSAQIADHQLNECLDKISDAIAEMRFAKDANLSPEETLTNVRGTLNKALEHGRKAKDWTHELAAGARER